MLLTILVWLVVGLVFAAVCAKIAHDKNLDCWGYAFGGLLLGIIGLIIVVVEPPAPKKSATDFVCARCGATGGQ